MDNLVEYLQKRITDKMSLENIVNVFEEMCRIPLENDMILFETGTFAFTDTPLFYFCLVRQFPSDDEEMEDEYVQVHVEVQYKSTSESEAFHSAIWNEDITENIFDYIRNSQAYAYAKNQEYVQIEIYMDET